MGAYDPRLDGARLALQVERVRKYMLGAEWRTLLEIKAALENLYAPTVFPESSISAQLRNLKKPPYSLQLAKRRRAGVHGAGAGIWEYRLLPPDRLELAEKERGSAQREVCAGNAVKPDDREDLEEFLRDARRSVFPDRSDS